MSNNRLPLPILGGGSLSNISPEKHPRCTQMKVKFEASCIKDNRMTSEEFLAALETIEILTDSFEAETDSAQEGVGVDILYDGLIGWLIHRNDHTLNELKATVPECIERIKNAPEDNFGEWEFLKQINIFSKYLPNQSQFATAVSALSKAAKYLISVKNPNKFDSAKFKSCFIGSCYAKKGKFSSDEVTGMGFWNLWTTDIRVRGWTKRSHFSTALQQMKSLLTDMQSISSYARILKNKEWPDNVDVHMVKEHVNSIKTTVKLMGYLGRGITSASRKISGSALKRIFATEM